MSTPSISPSPFAPVGDGVRIRVRVTPHAGRNAVTGLAPDADGGVALKVAVTAAAEGGKANAAVVKLLAAAWGVPKSAITIAAGATDRRKSLHLAGAPQRLQRALDDWLAARMAAV